MRINTNVLPPSITPHSHHRSNCLCPWLLPAFLLGCASILPVHSQFGPGIPLALNHNAGTDAGDDFSPRIASDSNGHWVSVWSSRENLGGTAGVDADIFYATSTNGIHWSATRTLNLNANTDTGDDFAPQIQVGTNGWWIAVWSSNENAGGTNGTDPDILYALSPDHGVTWVAPRPINTDAGTDTRADFSPAVATDRDGNWIVSWHGTGGGAFGNDQEIWLARSSDNGRTWNSPAPLNSNASSDGGSDFNVSLATDRHGRWLAVWSSNEDLAGSGDGDADIAWAQSLNNGATWSAPALLHSNFSSDNGEDFNPIVGTDRQRGWLVAWESGSSLGGTIGTDQDILFSRSTNHGATWSSPAALNASARTDNALDSFPSIATDAAGVWVATWHSQYALNDATGMDQDILASYSIDQGGTWRSLQPLASNAATDTAEDGSPHIATDEHGGWIVAWSGAPSSSGTDQDIAFVRILDPLLWSSPKFLNSNAPTDAGADFSPRLATDLAGNAIAVWMSNENLNGNTGTDLDILFSRSTNNGVTWSAPAVLNSNAANDSGEDRDARVATDGKGRWIAIWSSSDTLNNQTGNDSDVLFCVSTNNGINWSAATWLNSTATSDAVGDFSPAITTDRAGNWIAVWGTAGAYGSDFDVVVSRSAGGETWSAPAPLNANAANDDGDDFEPQIATDRDGRWIAVWMSNAELTGLGYHLGTDDDILVAYSSNNGASWTMPRPLNSNAASDAPDDDDYSPQIDANGAGSWIAVWHSEGTLGGMLATNFNVLFARSTDHGGTWSSPAPLHANAATDIGDDQSPQILSDRNSRWVVVWNSSSPDLGGNIGVLGERDIEISFSTDDGATWTPPAPLNTDGFIDENDDFSPHVALGAGGQWIAAWSWTTNLLGADADLQFATAFLPTRTATAILPLQVAPVTLTGTPPGTFLMQWNGGLPPYQVQRTASLTPASWANTGGLLCDRFAQFAVTGSNAFFRVLSLGNTPPILGWAGEPAYLQGGMNAVAETLFVDGFGINASVDVLVSGDLPLTVRRTIINNSAIPIAGGYTVREKLHGMTFVAVGGTAGYVPGAPSQQVFDCEVTNTPALAPGQTAVIEFTLGGAGCTPLAPITALPCGLFQETMTIESPQVANGLCTNTIVEVVDSNFIFVDDGSQIQIAAALNPDNAPSASVSGTTVNVFALPSPPVRTHQLTVTTIPPNLTYFVRGRSPITGPQAPTIGAFTPGIPQAPAPPLVVTGGTVLNYFVTVNPDYNGTPSCNVFGLPTSYQEKVNTTLTLISTNGCSIAQESLQATGIYECSF
ncbi:MAG TPA: sialidase family protein [Verrucomicrobiae bacterium]|nr:sialidase family protein [Verrucomicrobiae bacterium]